MRVNLSEPDNYDSATQSDFTYEIAAKNIPAKEVNAWRKWPLGNQPFGRTPSYIPFQTTQLKLIGIAISFTTLRANTTVSRGNLMPSPNPFQVHGETAFKNDMPSSLLM